MCGDMFVSMILQFREESLKPYSFFSGISEAVVFGLRTRESYCMLSRGFPCNRSTKEKEDVGGG